MAAVTGTLRVLETACCARVVSKLAELGTVEAARYRVEQSVEGQRGCDALGGEGVDVGGGEEAEGDGADLAGYGL